MYLLIIGTSVVNFLSAMEKMDGKEKLQAVAQGQVAALLGINVLQLQKLLPGFQDRETISIANEKDSKDWTRLMYIAEGRSLCEECTKERACLHEEYQERLRDIYLKTAEALIKNGINTYAENNNGESALMIASNNKNKPIVKLLLRLQHFVAIDNCFTLLDRAITLGWNDIAFQLISRKPIALEFLSRRAANNLKVISGGILGKKTNLDDDKKTKNVMSWVKNKGYDNIVVRASLGARDLLFVCGGMIIALYAINALLS